MVSQLTFLNGALKAMWLSLTNPGRVFQKMNWTVGVTITVLSFGAQLAAICVVAESRPAFLVKSVEAELRSKSVVIDARSTVAAVRARARAVASARLQQVIRDMVGIWVLSVAFVMAVRKGSGPDEVLVAVMAIALAGSLGGPSTNEGRHFWLDTGVVLGLGIIAGAFLQIRGRPALDVFNATAIANTVLATGFLIRQIATIVVGRDTGHVTLATLYPGPSGLTPLLARIDFFSMWWVVVLASPLASIAARPYALTATLLLAINVVALLSGVHRFVG